METSASFPSPSDLRGHSSQTVLSKQSSKLPATCRGSGRTGPSFVVIGVRDPELYLTRLRGLPRFAAIANNRLFGSPVAITAVSLKISLASLSMLLAEGLRQYHEPWLEIPT